ncbi:MAG TPA: HlyD family efflux transporter periplasmic adaptor subunit [Rhodanobacteraceae bacterium]|nr:HlyD family efflux transporter periplasmic adaptor subunit [Rhodanobacteraceae bacterium]
MRFRCGVLVLASALLLGACSSGDRTPAPAAALPQWLAVARGQVGVEGGMVEVSARTAGIVKRIEVAPGDAVHAGDVLALLDAQAATIDVAGARADVAAAKAQGAELRVALAQARVQAPRVAAAAKAGAATGTAADTAQAQVATLVARQAAAEAALEGAEQKLAAARLALAATVLKAPVAGTIVTRNVALGQAVAAAGGPLFELLPQRPHVVRAQLDADAAGGIHAGMRAEVVRDSGEGPVYQAKVLWVGQVLQSATLTTDPLQRALANDVDCTLELLPPAAGQPPLRIGQQVLVRFPRGPVQPAAGERKR